MKTTKRIGVEHNPFLAKRAASVAPVAAKMEGVRFTAAELAKFLARNPVHAEALSIQDGQAMLKAAMEIRNAPNFPIAFMNRVLKNDLLRELFLGWIAAVRGGHATVTAEKLSSGNHIYSTLEIHTWLSSVEAALQRMQAAQQETPVDLAALGLEIIDRGARLLKLNVSQPTVMGDALCDAAGAPGLDNVARRYLYNQVADLGVAHAASVDPEGARPTALARLRRAIPGLLHSGETGKRIDSLMVEALRISKNIDGPTSVAEQLTTLALLLKSPDQKVVAEAERTLAAQHRHLLDELFVTQSANGPIAAGLLTSLQKMVEIAGLSKPLLAQMPDLIEAMTLHPKLRPDAADRPVLTAYKPDASVVAAQTAMTSSLLDSLATAYPLHGLHPVDAVHAKVAQQAQMLVARTAALGSDPSDAIRKLVGQLTRHADLVASAADYVSETFIPDVSSRLSACQLLVENCLRHGHLDAAKEYFDTKFSVNDGLNYHREVAILATAAEEVSARRGKVEGGDVSIAWVANAHTRGLELALSLPTPALADAKRILKVMATDYEDWKLNPQDSLAVVDQVMAKTAAWPGYHELVPELVRILARHESDDGCMDRGKSLIQMFLQPLPAVGQHVPTPFGNWAVFPVALELIDAVADCRILAGFAPEIVGTLLRTVAFHTHPDARVMFAETVSQLGGPPKLREQLAYLLSDALIMTPPPSNLGQAPLVMFQTSLSVTMARVALAWAGAPETHQRAREVIVLFDRTYGTTEMKDLTAVHQAAYARMEVAVRLAVPGLMTEKTAKSLFDAFRGPKPAVREETVRHAGKYMPRDLVDLILKNVDYADVARVINAGQGEAAIAEEQVS